MSMCRQAWIAGIFAVGTSACAPGSPAPAEPVGEAASAVAAVCPGTQQVGHVQPGDACPAPASGSAWTFGPLFGGLATPLPADLSPYCLYTWTGSGAANLGALPGYQGEPSSTWLDPDCMAVAAMSDFTTAIGAVTPELEQAYFAELEAPTPMPPAPNGGPVRVAVIDTWPGVDRIGNFEHGFGMAAIARRTACHAPGACAVTPMPHLALDLVGPDERNIIMGGYFGYQSRLARAIVEAVVSHADQAPDDKLILNLSLGWDSRYTTGPDGLVTQPVLAVRAALEHAACAGALTIAAAGNAGSGPDPGSGPVYPAAWEQILAPSCAGPVPRPLVYAVGGVDARDIPLASARPGGQSVLAAPGYVVPGVLGTSTGDVITGPFTGTSVAAASASGIAAAVWHQNPSLRPDQVMDLLGSSAVVTADTADFCVSSTCPNVRRLSLCRALEATIGAALPCTKIPLGTGSNPVWSAPDLATIASLVTESYDGTNLVTPNLPPACSSSVFIPSGLTTFPDAYPCPSETLPSSIVAPTVGPQPPPDPCPACTLYRDLAAPSILYLVINERVPVAFPQIMVLSDRAGVVERYDLASARTTEGVALADGLLGGLAYKVELPPITASFEYATIEWVNTPDAETTSTLMIAP